MPEKFDAKRWRYPAAHAVIVLAIVFATETALMVLLPWLLPEGYPRYLEAAVDALLLTLVIAPVLWWIVVRPLREANHVRAEYLSHLFKSIEADRRQTAHDLHDGVGQSITLLVSGLRSMETAVTDPEQARRCQDLSQLARQALRDVKRLALGLRPSLLDDLGLAPALERIVTEVRENHPIEIQLEASSIANLRLPENVETALFRIIQEALANVVRHAKAHTATVDVVRRDHEILVVVADDGVGMTRAQLRSRHSGHLGLTGMKERATLLGGDLKVESTLGEGTRLTATIPLRGTAP